VESLLKRHLRAGIMSKIIPENDHPTPDLIEFKQVA
jgi:hypothetical protein